MMRAHLATAMVMAGRIRFLRPSQLNRLSATGPNCSTGPRPPAGTQPSMTANSMISMSPTQKLGREKPSTEPDMMARAGRLSGRRPAYTPSGTPTTMEMNMASVASSSVAGMRSRMSRMADSPVRKLLPKSSCTAFARKMPYCSQSGRSSPRLRRIASRSRSVASGLAIISTGSPIMYSAANTSADMTRTMTPVCRIRRMMVANTAAGSVGRPHVLRQSHLIGAAVVAHVVLHGPHRHLELQGQNAVVFHDHIARLLQQLRALVVVERARGLEHQCVDFGVRILAPVRGAQAAIGLLGHDQQVERVEHFA